MKWDLLIRRGTVVDPSQGLHGIADIAISPVTGLPRWAWD